MAKNITLAVDEDVLEAVRSYAAAHKTSVNAIVRDALKQIAARSTKAGNDWDELFRLADESGAEVGEITWTRDDLYDRR
jgi:plasmid stability protein